MWRHLILCVCPSLTHHTDWYPVMPSLVRPHFTFQRQTNSHARLFQLATHAVTDRSWTCHGHGMDTGFDKVRPLGFLVKLKLNPPSPLPPSPRMACYVKATWHFTVGSLSIMHKTQKNTCSHLNNKETWTLAYSNKLRDLRPIHTSLWTNYKYCFNTRPGK